MTRQLTRHSSTSRAARSGELSARIRRVATGRAARTAYVIIGVAGLAGLGLALFGPRRFQRQILIPLRDAAAGGSERLWNEAGPLRAQIGALVEKAREQGLREALVRNFQSWIGHFRAT